MTALTKVQDTAIVEVKQFGDTAIEKFLASRSVSENSVKTYRNALRRLFGFFAAKEIATPTEADVNAFVNDLRGNGKSVATIRLYTTVAKAFFAWTGRKGFYPNVAADVKAKLRKSATHNKKALTLNQAQKLLGAIKGNAKHWKVIHTRLFKGKSPASVRSVSQIERSHEIMTHFRPIQCLKNRMLHVRF